MLQILKNMANAVKEKLQEWGNDFQKRINRVNSGLRISRYFMLLMIDGISESFNELSKSFKKLFELMGILPLCRAIYSYAYNYIFSPTYTHILNPVHDTLSRFSYYNFFVKTCRDSYNFLSRTVRNTWESRKIIRLSVLVNFLEWIREAGKEGLFKKAGEEGAKDKKVLEWTKIEKHYLEAIQLASKTVESINPENLSQASALRFEELGEELLVAKYKAIDHKTIFDGDLSDNYKDQQTQQTQKELVDIDNKLTKNAELLIFTTKKSDPGNDAIDSESDRNTRITELRQQYKNKYR